MVTKLRVGHRMERNTAFLFGSLSSSHKFSGYWAAVIGPWPKQVSRPAVESNIARCWGMRAQIFDNLVGCSKEELVRTLSKNRNDLN